MSEPPAALRLDGLTKAFPRGTGRVTLLQLLRSFAGNGGAGTRRLALEAITLAIPQGAIIGVVGQNGAGKTTLLKTMAGLYAPTSGTIAARGEVALLAGLGAGMVDELSVADNVWLYGAVLRIRRATIDARFGDILRWAGLDGHAGNELRTLSTGTRTRLAFAIGMQIESDIILIDEAFSAGDRRFQEQCDRYFTTARGRHTFVVATHNLDWVRQFCDLTLWLHEGRVREFDRTAAVLDGYTRFVES